MDYVIECRPSRSFLEVLSRVDQKELAESLSRAVLFARNISCEDGPGREDARSMAREAFGEALESLPPEIQIEFDHLDVEDGSVIIILFVTAVILPHTAAGAAAGVGVGTVGIWAAGKFVGGALEEFGKKFVEKLSGMFGRGKQNKVGAEPPVIITNPQQIADYAALTTAAQHGCEAALIVGGVDIGDHIYRYSYSLRRCRKKTISIDVDPRNLKPLVITVT